MEMIICPRKENIAKNSKFWFKKRVWCRNNVSTLFQVTVKKRDLQAQLFIFEIIIILGLCMELSGFRLLFLGFKHFKLF